MNSTRHEEIHRRSAKARAVVCVFLLFLGLVLWGPSVYINLYTRPLRYEPTATTIAEIPMHTTGIVFGGGLQENGREPTPFLRWRVEAAVALYKAGRVKQLLMTGDGSYPTHDEPAIMKSVAIQLGVPSDDIIMDKFGFDTYDSCYRAYHVRDVHDAIVITQGYHLPRAVYTCQKIGINTIGVNAHTQVKSWGAGWYLFREWLSTDKLFLQLGYHALKDRLQ